MNPDEPDPYLAEHLRDTLAQDPRVNELGLQVVIRSRKVFLTGNVMTTERRGAISEVAEEVLPGYEIHNEVTVGALGGTTEMEQLR